MIYTTNLNWWSPDFWTINSSVQVPAPQERVAAGGVHPSQASVSQARMMAYWWPPYESLRYIFVTKAKLNQVYRYDSIILRFMMIYA